MVTPKDIVEQQVVALDRGLDSFEIGDAYFMLLQVLDAPAFKRHASAVILAEEALSRGTYCSALLHQSSIPIIMKADEGRVNNELQGLGEGLADRLGKAKGQYGIVAAKARAPIDLAGDVREQIMLNAPHLNNLSAACHDVGIYAVPEWDVLVKGNHTLDDCLAATTMAYAALEGASLLKVSPVLPGKRYLYKRPKDGEIATVSFDEIVQANQEFLGKVDVPVLYLSGGVGEVVLPIIGALRKDYSIAPCFGRGALQLGTDTITKAYMREDVDGFLARSLGRIKQHL